MPCAIITCAANELVANIHDRMPVILQPDQYDLWLSANLEPEPLLSLLQPADWPSITLHPVSTNVNRASNNDPTLVQPINSLF